MAKSNLKNINNILVKKDNLYLYDYKQSNYIMCQHFFFLSKLINELNYFFKMHIVPAHQHVKANDYIYNIKKSTLKNKTLKELTITKPYINFLSKYTYLNKLNLLHNNNLNSIQTSDNFYKNNNFYKIQNIKLKTNIYDILKFYNKTNNKNFNLYKNKNYFFKSTRNKKFLANNTINKLSVYLNLADNSENIKDFKKNFNKYKNFFYFNKRTMRFWNKLKKNYYAIKIQQTFFNKVYLNNNIDFLFLYMLICIKLNKLKYINIDIEKIENNIFNFLQYIDSFYHNQINNVYLKLFKNKNYFLTNRMLKLYYTKFPFRLFQYIDWFKDVYLFSEPNTDFDSDINLDEEFNFLKIKKNYIFTNEDKLKIYSNYNNFDNTISVFNSDYYNNSSRLKMLELKNKFYLKSYLVVYKKKFLIRKKLHINNYFFIDLSINIFFWKDILIILYKSIDLMYYMRLFSYINSKKKKKENYVINFKFFFSAWRNYFWMSHYFRKYNPWRQNYKIMWKALDPRKERIKGKYTKLFLLKKKIYIN